MSVEKRVAAYRWAQQNFISGFDCTQSHNQQGSSIGPYTQWRFNTEEKALIFSLKYS